jgi:hypothetical protein
MVTTVDKGGSVARRDDSEVTRSEKLRRDDVFVIGRHVLDVAQPTQIPRGAGSGFSAFTLTVLTTHTVAFCQVIFDYPDGANNSLNRAILKGTL